MTQGRRFDAADDWDISNHVEPLFSVIIPTYNRAELVVRAIEGVLAQDFTEFELLVADDGSTDDTKQRVEAIDDRRLRYLHLPHAGAAQAQNVAAQHAVGRFLIFLDSDDEALPGWLSAIAQAAASGAVVVSTEAWTVHHDGGERKRSTELAYPGSGIRTLILSGTYAIRRSVFNNLGGFDESLRSGTKTDMSLKLLDYLGDAPDSIVHIDVPLVLHHRNSPLSVREDDMAVLEGAEVLLSRYSSALAGLPEVRADYHGVAGVRAMRVGQTKRARSHLWASARLDPTSFKRWVRLIAAVTPWARYLWLTSRSGDRSNDRNAAIRHQQPLPTPETDYDRP